MSEHHPMSTVSGLSLTPQEANLTQEEFGKVAASFKKEQVQSAFNSQFWHLLKYLRQTTNNPSFFVEVTEDPKMPTAAMYIERGNMVIDKNFFLRCLWSLDWFSPDFLMWVFHHENNHHLDTYNPHNKWWLFPQQLGQYKAFMEEIHEYIKATYPEPFNQQANYLVHRFFNAVDDIYVNKLIEVQNSHYATGGEKGVQVYDIYRKTLFPIMDFAAWGGLQIESLGHLMLNRIMRPADELTAGADIDAVSAKVLPTVHEWIDFQNFEWKKRPNDPKTFHWLRRYVEFYRPVLWPIMKELLDKDMENLKADADFMKQVQDFMNQHWSPHEGDPSDTDWWNIFQKEAKEAEGQIDKAIGTQNWALNKWREAANKRKPQSHRNEEAKASRAAHHAKTAGVTFNDAVLFEETIESYDKQIESMANAILHLLSLDVEYIEQTIVEYRREKWNLSVADLIPELPQLFDPTNAHGKIRAFDKKYILEKIIPRFQDLIMRFLLDNSWSMENIFKLLKQNIIIFLAALERVKYRLMNDDITTMWIHVWVMSYWNSPRFIQPTLNIFDRKTTTEFKDSTLAILGALDASEWTDNAPAWQSALDDMKPGEPTNPKVHSFVLDITDGFTVSPTETKARVDALRALWIGAYSIIIKNDVALDQKPEDLLPDDIKELLKKENLTPQESNALRESIARSREEWQSLNAEALNNNPAQEIWWDHAYVIESANDILKVFLFILTEKIHGTRISAENKAVLNQQISSLLLN